MVALAERVLPPELEARAERIVRALREVAERYSATGAAPRIALEDLRFTRVTDPSNRQSGYEGVWRDARDRRCGVMVFNSDSSFHAEFDLFCPHPRDTRWFVETVAAWGNAESLRSEAQLIPAL